MSAKRQIIIGVDEAGRGPLAGPLVVAAVAGRAGGNKILKGIKDSKKLSHQRRTEWAKILRKNFECHYVSVSSKKIDEMGIQRAALYGVAAVLRKFKRKPKLVLLDGLLKAPDRYNQKTITKGDEKIPLISAASIIAKTARDRQMKRFHKEFPKYGFEKHKGYGTKLHREKIRAYGLSKIHRKTFYCKN